MRFDLGLAVAVLALAAVVSGCGLLLDEMFAPADIRAAKAREREAAAAQARQNEAEAEVGAEMNAGDRVESDLAALERHLMSVSCVAEVEEARADALLRMRIAGDERERFYLCTAAAQPSAGDVAVLACVIGLASGATGTVATCGAVPEARCGLAPPPLPTWPAVGLEELLARGMSSPPPCFTVAPSARVR